MISNKVFPVDTFEPKDRYQYLHEVYDPIVMLSVTKPQQISHRNLKITTILTLNYEIKNVFTLRIRIFTKDSVLV